MCLVLTINSPWLSKTFPDEFTWIRTFRIDLGGDINLPLAGRLHAAGLTIDDFEVQVQQRLERYVKDPQVVATITEFNSQPVSVLGAVNNAGVKQVAGHKTLFEVLSLSGRPPPGRGQLH
jgi:polysaccharide export outer membrane protein